MRNFLATSGKNKLQLSFLLVKKKIAWNSISTLGMTRWASGWVAKATLGILRGKGPHRDSELQEAGIQVSQQLMKTHDRPSSQLCSRRRQNPLLLLGYFTNFTHIGTQVLPKPLIQQALATDITGRSSNFTYTKDVM